MKGGESERLKVIYSEAGKDRYEFQYKELQKISLSPIAISFATFFPRPTGPRPFQ